MEIWINMFKPIKFKHDIFSLRSKLQSRPIGPNKDGLNTLKLHLFPYQSI